MNSFLFSLITFCWLYFLLLGWTGNGSTIFTIAQIVDDSTKVVTVLIDTDRSLVRWKGTEMWESGKHEGTLNLSEGYLLLQNGQLVGGYFVADMNSIAITDIPEYEPVPRRNLRNHLKSEDFFYVKEYPTAKFEITRTEALKADSLRIWGDLSIRDVTKTVSFTASQKPKHKNKTEFYATFNIDRFKWNISYQGSYWDRLTSILDNTFVDADISLSVELVISSTEDR